jgi:hypothetical protein
MSIGDYIHQLTEKEVDSAPVIQRRFALTLGSPAAVGTLTLDGPPVPTEYYERITWIGARGFAGAAQTVTSFRWQIIAPPNQLLMHVNTVRFAAPIQFDDAGFFTNLYLAPGEFIRLLASFSAAGVANNAEISSHGMLIPKGNLQLR